MPERFISEVIQLVIGTIETGRMAAGEPGLPRQFRRGHDVVEVAEVVRTWRETGPCSHGSRERYLRKHWYEVRSAQGSTLKLYFERQQRGATPKARWILYTEAD